MLCFKLAEYILYSWISAKTINLYKVVVDVLLFIVVMFFLQIIFRLCFAIFNDKQDDDNCIKNTTHNFLLMITCAISPLLFYLFIKNILALHTDKTKYLAGYYSNVLTHFWNPQKFSVCQSCLSTLFMFFLFLQKISCEGQTGFQTFVIFRD